MYSENLLDNTLTFTFLNNLSSVLSTQKLWKAEILWKEL